MKRQLSRGDVLASLAALELQHRWEQALAESARLPLGSDDGTLRELIERVFPDRDLPATRLAVARTRWGFDDRPARAATATIMVLFIWFMAAWNTWHGTWKQDRLWAVFEFPGSGVVWLVFMTGAMGWASWTTLGGYVGKAVRGLGIVMTGAGRSRTLLRSGLLAMLREHRAGAAAAANADLARTIQSRRS